MNLFRSNIPRIYVTLTLLMSFALHFMQPASESAKHSAFTSWLGTHLISDDDANVRKQLKELGNSTDELEAIIRKASELVTTNAEDFELDFQKSDKNEIFKLLLTEWNSYMDSQQGMAKGVVITSLKSNAIQQGEGKTLFKTTFPDVNSHKVCTSSSTLFQKALAANTVTEPLPFGIAIGAP